LRLLLDSNVLLWSIFNRALLTPLVLESLVDERNELFVSRASLWELSIKVAKGKLAMPGSSIRYLFDQIDHTGIAIVPIEDAHILRTESLPHHHGDPFDRLLIAQAMEEDLTILSSDNEIPLYAVKVIWK
jgi:PIN domain nuclease of toxin-antitoxin system